MQRYMNNNSIMVLHNYSVILQHRMSITFSLTSFDITIFLLIQLSVDPLPLFLFLLRGKVDLLCGCVILLARNTNGSMRVRRSTTDTSQRRTFSFLAQFCAMFASTLRSSGLSSLFPSTIIVTSFLSL